MEDLKKQDLKLTNRERLENLKAENEELEDQIFNQELIQKRAKMEQIFAQNRLKIAKDLLETNKDSYHLNERVAEETAKITESQAKIAEAEKIIAGLKIKEYETSKKIKDATLAQADIDFARKNNLERLIDDKQKEVLLLERANARSKALREGGLEQLEIVNRQIEKEDKIVELFKTKRMTLEQAVNLAGKLVDANNEEQRLRKQANELQVEAKKLTEEERKEAERVLEALRKKIAIQQANQAMVDQELAVLRLQARGQNDLADLLKARMENEQKLLDIQKNQGLELGKAVNQRKEEVALRAKIKNNALELQKKEIQANAVEFQAKRKLRDAVDFNDKKRIRAGKEIERIDKRIAKLQAGNAIFKDRDIAKLKARRDQQLALVLDDQAKAQIDRINKDKADLKKNFDAQMKAIELAEKKIKQQEQKVAQDLANAKVEIAREGDVQKQKVQGVLDAGKNAIKEAGRGIVKEIKNIKQAPININNIQNQGKNLNVPQGSEPQKVFVVNQLEQGTQDNILRTLKGYFVNQ